MPIGDYLRKSKTLLQNRALLTRSVDDQIQAANAQEPLRKCLGSLDLLLLGLGSILGTGAFVLTGVAAREHAGPAVVVSYAIAALAALLSGLAYAEFAVDLPVAGGATTCILLTFGELASWIVACNLILEYTLSVAVCARAATAYGATLLGLQPESALIMLGPLQLDVCAVLLVAALGMLLALGTKESAAFNSVVTGMNVIAIIYVLCVGAPFAHGSNLHPFAPFGVRGIFSAASVVFFAFVGFDSVATVAEEVEDPAASLPIGIVGAVAISAMLYIGLSAVICAMVPYQDIQAGAPFSQAFLSLVSPADGRLRSALLHTSARFVSFGAVTGIVTSALVSLMGQARIYVLLGRERLLPPWLAHIHPDRKTPVNATLLTSLSAGLLAFLVDLEVLAELVSIGTLFAFFAVSAGLIWRRCMGDSHAVPDQAPDVARRLGAVVALSLVLSISFNAHGPGWLVAVAAAFWLSAVVWLSLLPVVYTPTKFRMPGAPFTTSLAILANLHLICSMSWQAYVRFGVWMALSLAVYCLYSVHSTDGQYTAVETHTERPGQGRGEDELDAEDRGLLEMGQLHSRSDIPSAQQFVPLNGAGSYSEVRHQLGAQQAGPAEPAATSFRHSATKERAGSSSGSLPTDELRGKIDGALVGAPRDKNADFWGDDDIIADMGKSHARSNNQPHRWRT
ncbi:Cationic amino acid transporter 1 [Coccomyxa sp. Obi]|nr:Cationic amino acid transporter 1 [Coccomyxa sp. Obi]